MSAFVKVLTHDEMKIIEDLLDREGVVLVMPGAAEELKKKFGVSDNDLEGIYLDGYNYGGKADVWVDISHAGGDYPAEKIAAYLKGNGCADEEQQSIKALTKEEVVSISNQDKRYDFIRKYVDWGIWYEDDKIDARYYRCDLPDGSYIVVAVFRTSSEYFKHPKGEYSIERYSLVKADHYYTPGSYNIERDIVDHLKILRSRYKETRRENK